MSVSISKGYLEAAVRDLPVAASALPPGRTLRLSWWGLRDRVMTRRVSDIHATARVLRIHQEVAEHEGAVERWWAETIHTIDLALAISAEPQPDEPDTIADISAWPGPDQVGTGAAVDWAEQARLAARARANQARRTDAAAAAATERRELLVDRRHASTLAENAAASWATWARLQTAVYLRARCGIFGLARRDDRSTQVPPYTRATSFTVGNQPTVLA